MLRALQRGRFRNVVAMSGGILSFYKQVLSIETANLLGFWPIDEISGTTIDNAQGLAARDGTATNITLNNTTFLNGDPAALFPGSPAGRINIYSDSLRDALNGDECTLMLAFKPRNAAMWTDSTLRRLLTLYSSDAAGRMIFEKGSNDYALTLYRIASGTKSLTRYTALTDWLLIFLAFSRGSNDWRMRVNGHQIGTNNTLGAWPATLLNTTYSTIGATTNTGTNPTNGWLAQGAIWSKALTNTQMDNLWNKVKPSGNDIFVIGDSKSAYTVQSGLWVDMLFENLKTATGTGWYENVGRVGIGGYDMGEMDTYLQANLSSINGSPNLIIISMGANDAPQPTPEADFKSQLASIIDQVRIKFPGKPVYVSKPWRQDYDANCTILAGYIDAVLATYSSGVYAGSDETVWFKNGAATYLNVGEDVHWNPAGAVEAASQWKTILGY